jgi:nicotinamide mononucleotide transporter
MMSFHKIYESWVTGLNQTTIWEFIAVFFGILSVILSRMENIWVYPTGLINTILYTYFCYVWWNLKGEASLNLYYTIMSIYGWWLWNKRKRGSTEKEVSIQYSTRREWIVSMIFFIVCWTVLYLVLKNYT